MCMLSKLYFNMNKSNQANNTDISKNLAKHKCGCLISKILANKRFSFNICIQAKMQHS